MTGGTAFITRLCVALALSLVMAGASGCGLAGGPTRFEVTQAQVNTRGSRVQVLLQQNLELSREAQRAGLAARTDYRQGDFVDLADGIEPADIVVLDKVVCCYPDAERLLAAALGRTQRVLALTYPRDRAATRAGVALMTALLRLAGCRFRPYVHDPASIEHWIRRAGFHPHSRSHTFALVTDIYLLG